MTDDTSAPGPAFQDRSSLTEQMQRLQAYVAAAHARGESVPPEADLMIARLKELVGALDELTNSMTAGARDEGPVRESES